MNMSAFRIGIVDSGTKYVICDCALLLSVLLPLKPTICSWLKDMGGLKWEGAAWGGVLGGGGGGVCVCV